MSPDTVSTTTVSTTTVSPASDGGVGEQPASLPGGSDCAVSLVESRTGWTLTVAMSADLIRTLAEQAARADSTGAAVAAGTATVQIAPNLVPGGPFTVDLVLHHGRSLPA